MKYNFDEPVDRRGTNSIKHDRMERFFGTDSLLPLWVADMDFKTPDCILEPIRKRISHGIFGYNARPESFYESIIRWMRIRHAWDLPRDWISYSPGVVPSLNLCVLAFTRPGDGIIVQTPVYHLFYSAVRDHDRKLVINGLVNNRGRYEIDFESLENCMKNGAVMLILCSPHNPVGRVWSREELERIALLCDKYGVLPVSDEIHSDLVYEGYSHLPFASLSDCPVSNSVTCISPSKTFNLAGMPASAVIIPDSGLRTSFRKIIDSLHIGGGNVPGDLALEAAYMNGEEWLNALNEYLMANRNFAVNFLAKHIPEMTVRAPEATYLLWMDFRFLGLSDEELRRMMTEQAGVALSDGPLFGPEGSGFQRLNFACPRSFLETALMKIAAAVRKG